MKKTTVSALVFCLASTAAAAETELPNNDAQQKDSNIYIGLDFFNGDTEFDSEGMNKLETDQKGFRFKIGVLVENGIRIEGFFKKEETEENAVLYSDGFSFEYIQFDKSIFGLGANAIKTFSTTIKVSPFVRIGAGYDWRDVGSSPGIVLTEDSQMGVNINLGLGAIVKVADRIELNGGFDWQYRTWQEIEFVGVDVENLEISDTATNFYLGANFFF